MKNTPPETTLFKLITTITPIAKAVDVMCPAISRRCCHWLRRIISG